MAAVETVQAEQDLPDYLSRDFLMKLRRPQDFAGRDDELEKLVEKVTLYDTYGQTGYLVMRVNNTILQKARDKFLRA